MDSTTILDIIAIIGLGVGAALFLVNRPGGSGYDFFDTVRYFTGKGDTASTRTSPKIFPRFKYGMLVGILIFLVSLAYLYLAHGSVAAP